MHTKYFSSYENVLNMFKSCLCAQNLFTHAQIHNLNAHKQLKNVQLLMDIISKAQNNNDLYLTP